MSLLLMHEIGVDASIKYTVPSGFFLYFVYIYLYKDVISVDRMFNKLVLFVTILILSDKNFVKVQFFDQKEGMEFKLCINIFLMPK